MLPGAVGLMVALFLQRGQAAEYPQASSGTTPTEQAAVEAIRLSERTGALRFGGIDLFPHAAVGVMYDDNLLITPTNQIKDLLWTLSPGLTAVAGDVTLYLPDIVTVDQLRSLLRYAPVDDESKPSRFAGLDFTPTLRYYSQNSRYNGVDFSGQFSAGYKFSKLALGLDQDATRSTTKSPDAANLVTIMTYRTALRTRYDLSDRNSIEVNGSYQRYDYETSQYYGFKEFVNENWFNRQAFAKLNLGVGLAFGFLEPAQYVSQTYQQLLVQGTYLATGKMRVNLSAGGEYRQFQNDDPSSLSPVFSLTAAYQPGERTVFSLEGHHRQSPSSTSSRNYTATGFSLGARQTVYGRFSVNLAVGYESTQYGSPKSFTGPDRTDSRFRVRTSLDYGFESRWGASVFYEFGQNSSSDRRYDFANNQAGVSVLWYY